MTPLVIGLAAVIVVILVAVAVGLRFVRNDERADLAERPADRGGARNRKDPGRRGNGPRALPDRIPARQDDLPQLRARQDDLPQLRARQVRGRRDDAADWPSTEWDKLSDADYWKEVASDRPLTTTARTAQPQSGHGRGAGLPPAAVPPPAAAQLPPAAVPPPVAVPPPFAAVPPPAAAYGRDLLAAPTSGLAPGSGRPEPGRPDLALRGHPGAMADPGQPGRLLRPRPVPVTDDNDPLTSPSFPTVVTSDSRSYRNGRSAEATTATYSYRQAPQPAPGNYAAASYQPTGHVAASGSGIPAGPHQPGRPAPGGTEPAASPPTGNPYGSYVSSDLPGYLDNPALAYHRASPEPGYASYPADAGNGRAASPYLHGSPVVNSTPPGDSWKSSWYPDAPAPSAPAPSAPGSYPDGHYDLPGYPAGEFHGRDDYGGQQRR
jgi:hypothetical protein